MTATHSAVSTLIDQVLSDPEPAHDDVFRRLLGAGLQYLVDAEAAVRIGADRFGRAGEGKTRRNGTRPTSVVTPSGEVALNVPTLRQGSFLTTLLAPR